MSVNFHQQVSDGMEPDGHAREPEFLRRLREAREVGRRTRLRVTGGLLAVGIPVSLTAMGAALVLYSRSMREVNRTGGQGRPDGAFLVLSAVRSQGSILQDLSCSNVPCRYPSPAANPDVARLNPLCRHHQLGRYRSWRSFRPMQSGSEQ